MVHALRAALALLIAASTVLPALPLSGAATATEPCADGSTLLCTVESYYYRKNAKLSSEPGTKLPYDPDTIVLGWNGTSYRTVLQELPRDFTFFGQDSLTLVLYRDVTRTDTYTTIVEVTAYDKVTGAEMVLLPQTPFVARVEASGPENIAVGPGGEPLGAPALPKLPVLNCHGASYCPVINAAGSVAKAVNGFIPEGQQPTRELQENWNVIRASFGADITVPAGWSLAVQVYTLVGDGHAEEEHLQKLNGPRFNPTGVPRPSILYRQESEAFPTHAEFRLVA